MHFQLEKEDSISSARAGLLHTDHGTIQTPIFMPVGTLGTVKGVHQRELTEMGAQIILGNTYHLYLRPGTEILEEAGGLHRFMGWQGPILTDSGGYQVHSLAHRRTLSEEGVTFASHIDGSRHLFTPEKVVDIQRTIGADIIMPLDECTPSDCSYAYAEASMERTHRWLLRTVQHLAITEPAHGHAQGLFPIVQGSTYRDLRMRAVAFVTKETPHSPGYAIGGVCHPTGQLYDVTQWVCDALPHAKPRYLMGVGTPKDLLTCIGLGVDMFDCVMPARNGRNGMLFTTQGILNIGNRRWARDFTPLDGALGGYASTQHSKAYLHHLHRTGERLAAQVATLHNLRFYLWLVQEARKHILAGDFGSWQQTILAQVMQRR